MKIPTVTGGQLVLIAIAALVALFLPLPILGIVLVILGVFGKYFGLGFRTRVIVGLLGIVLLMLSSFIVAAILTLGGH